MTVSRANEDRRNDPELKAKIARILEAQRTQMQEAATILRQLATDMRALSGFDQAIYDRSVYAVSLAASKVEGDAQFLSRPETDCYLGNMAAFTMGEIVLATDVDKLLAGRE